MWNINLFILNDIILHLQRRPLHPPWLSQLSYKDKCTFHHLVGHLCHLNEGFVGAFSEVITLLPSVDEIHHHVAGTSREVITDTGIEILSFKSRLY